MAKIEGVPRLLSDQFPKEVQGWIGSLLDPLNQGLGSLFGALRGKITFQDNIYSETKALTVTHGVSLTNIRHNLTKVSGVSLIKTPDNSSSNYAVTAWHWWTIDNNNIGIYLEFKGVGTTSGEIKIRIEGE